MPWPTNSRTTEYPAASATSCTAAEMSAMCPPGRVAVIALVAHAEIEPDDVALAEHAAGRGDAVHDLVVDRDANRCRKHAAGHRVALERGGSPLLAGELFREGIELARGDAGPDAGAHFGEDLGDDRVRHPHPLDLVA